VSGGADFPALDPKANVWSGPAFYTIGQVSFGLIAAPGLGSGPGRIDRSCVSALLSTSSKLSVDAAIAVGPVGVGPRLPQPTQRGHRQLRTEQGIVRRPVVERCGVGIRDALNAAYYGNAVTPAQILIQRRVTNPHANGLIEAVSRQAGVRGEEASWNNCESHSPQGLGTQ